MPAVADRTRSSPRRRGGLDRAPLVSIRPIAATDADDLSAFYARLSEESRRTRFFGLAQGLSPSQAEDFATCDHQRRTGYVAVLHEAGPRDGAIVGHACVEPVGSGGCEIAFAVEDRFQGLGIGRRLLRATIAWSRRRGVRSLSALVLGDNVVMRRLASGAGLPVRFGPVKDGVQEIELLLDETARAA